MKARRSVEMAGGATESAPSSTCGTLPHHAVLSHRAEELIELVSEVMRPGLMCHCLHQPYQARVNKTPSRNSSSFENVIVL
jgi:hypothetical protein